MGINITINLLKLARTMVSITIENITLAIVGLTAVLATWPSIQIHRIAVTI